jgi:cytidyltransferase-like protein
MIRDVVVVGAFDDLSARQVRFLHEASRLGKVQVYLWADETVQAQTGAPPRFPLDERQYLLESLRFVSQVQVIWPQDVDALPYLDEDNQPIWVVDEAEHNERKRLFAISFGLGYHVVKGADLEGWPVLPVPAASGKKKVIVTGCYDWLHSGHVRFFEEASQYGELYVAVGHDANLRLLKGESHPLFGQDQRRYMVQAVRFVHQALVTTGEGWMDAAPEIAALRPDIYLVNQDGDQPEKRQFCLEHGLEYVVLKRLPKAGLPRRVSTELRGF